MSSVKLDPTITCKIRLNLCKYDLIESTSCMTICELIPLLGVTDSIAAVLAFIDFNLFLLLLSITDAWLELESVF